MTIELKSKSGGGSGLPKLAPDLNFPIERYSTSGIHRKISPIDVSGGTLQTVLSLTGKFAVSFLTVNDLTNAGIVSSKLTIDGVVIHDSANYTVSTRDIFIGVGTTAPSSLESIVVESTLLFEYATAVDTSISLIFAARPIL